VAEIEADMAEAVEEEEIAGTELGAGDDLPTPN
jgi:hypothetical protein